MARVVHFEILADDVERCAKFYRDVFGWKIEGMGGEQYLLITTGADTERGINGAIMPRMGPFPTKNGFQAYVCTVEGAEINLDEMIKKVTVAGGKQLSSKKEIPHVGIHAYFEDTEGNAFGILQSAR